ncbi:MAG: hypothetical protein M0Z67_14805 [Nitrospiraceae bacterium]|nr:hypothetical protein [Nitrospiraceae bacterium]
MKKAVFAVICLTVLMIISGCSGSGSDAPSGAVMTLTPSEKITVESASSTIESASQTFHVAVKDSKATNAPGVRDVTFSISFGFANPPDTNILSDAAGAVTLCDGTRIVGTPVVRTTDNKGNYDLCILYKSGGGLAYSGSLVVASGDQSPSVGLEVTSKPQALAVSPSPQTVPAGSTAQFNIVGGIPPYTVSANPSVLLPAPSTVGSSGGSFTVAVPFGTPDGISVIYTIIDSVGTQASVTLTVGKPASQPKVFPDSLKILPGESGQFIIIDGLPPYTIITNNAAVPPSPSIVDLSGGTFTINIPPTMTPGTPITFTIRDTAGSIISATVTVDTPPALVVSPSTVTLTAGSSQVFRVTGGIPPYSIASNNSSAQPFPSAISTSGGTYSVTAPLTPPTGPITYTITDAAGSVVPATVTVTALPLRITPSNVTLAPGATQSFSISGGTPPYVTSSSNANFAYNGTPGNGSWTTSVISVNIDPAATPGGTVTLNVQDSGGLTASSVITIQ